MGGNDVAAGDDLRLVVCWLDCKGDSLFSYVSRLVLCVGSGGKVAVFEEESGQRFRLDQPVGMFSHMPWPVSETKTERNLRFMSKGELSTAFLLSSLYAGDIEPYVRSAMISLVAEARSFFGRFAGWSRRIDLVLAGSVSGMRRMS